jgi:hypothetical protein
MGGICSRHGRDEFLEQLNVYQFLKKDSAPKRWLVGWLVGWLVN